MILIALGANLSSKHGTPLQTLSAAKVALMARGVTIEQSSRIWLTAPVPFDPGQEWYHNAVVAVKTELRPLALLDLMLAIEEEFGRVRTVKNAPRLLDLDLIAYHDEILREKERLILPHPRMHERLFVLKPLEDISKNWTHPKTGHDVTKMLHDMGAGQQAKPLENEGAGTW